jgi:hypothetical protein
MSSPGQETFQGKEGYSALLFLGGYPTHCGSEGKRANIECDFGQQAFRLLRHFAEFESQMLLLSIQVCKQDGSQPRWFQRCLCPDESLLMRKSVNGPHCVKPFRSRFALVRRGSPPFVSCFSMAPRINRSSRPSRGKISSRSLIGRGWYSRAKKIARGNRTRPTSCFGRNKLRTKGCQVARIAYPEKGGAYGGLLPARSNEIACATIRPGLILSGKFLVALHER